MSEKNIKETSKAKELENINSKDTSQSDKVTRLCIKGVSIKEVDGKTIVKGLAATTHPDRVGDIMSRKSLEQIADYINTENTAGSEDGHYRGVSVYHDWIKEGNPTLDEAAILKPNAKVVELEDGHYGVEVECVINNFYRGDMSVEEIKSRIEDGLIAGFSIEYRTDEHNSHSVDYKGKEYRFIEELTDFAGIAFARGRMIANPYAVIYKEIEESMLNDKEAINMSEENKKNKVEVPEAKETKPEEEKTEKKPQEEEEEMEDKSCGTKKKKAMKETEEEKPVEEEKPEQEPEAKKKKEEIKEKESKLDIKEILESKEFKEIIDELKPAKKVIKVKEEKKMKGISLQIKEMNDAIKSKDMLSFKEAARKTFAMKEVDSAFRGHGLVLDTPTLRVDSVSNNNMGIKTKLAVVGQLETKDTLDTESNPSTYTQNAAELNNIFVPGLIDTFNNRTDLFDALDKKPHIMGSDNYGWRISTSQKSSLSVDVNNPTVTKSFSDKLKLQTPIKGYRNGISVTDFMVRHSRASIGDLFMIEAEKAMLDLRKDINKDLFTEQADGDGTKVLGLEAVADSAGNTTLYGLTRSTANRLAPDAAGDTYTAVGGALTTSALRTAYRKVWEEGAQFGNLMIVTGPKQRQALFELLDGQQQLFTEADFGFSGAIRFDGIPVLTDSDCQEDAMYVVDRESYYVVMSVMPQLTGLAKVSAAEEAFVETNLAVVYEQPRRIHMLNTLS